jgi:serine/threonine protein kinase
LPAAVDPLRLGGVTDHLVVGGQLGNYLIDSVIGRGGMSVVYGAKHARLGMPVALKVLAPELSTNDTFRERFLREAQIAAGIDHPNVIPIHDMGLHEDSLYIVMRYVAGGDLKVHLSNSGPLELERALVVLTPVALALDTAHAHGLVHRDVKPANILLQRSTAGEIEHVYLTDFGIAKSASFGGALTGAGASIGTVGYMAPEQLEGREVSARTDVYALTVTFYECLTGRIPFQRELAEGIHPPIGPLEPLSGLRPDLPPALDAVLAKGLSRSPVDRYATCELFIRACREASTGDSPEMDESTRKDITATARSAPGTTEAIAAAPPMSHASALAPESMVAQSAASPPRDGERPQPAPARPSGRQSRSSAAGGRRWLYAALLAAAIAVVVTVVVLSSSSSTPTGKLSASALAPVPTNHVTGSGDATVRLNGNRAAVTVTTSGLDNSAELVHLMHIHAGGKGECPPASAARLHNGHRAISTTDGINYYGPPVQALTTRGDTSVSSILAFPRFLTGGALHYTRTITLPANVVADIRRNDAVVVVHGTDYDGTGIYSGVLDVSELNKGVPGTATAPALCGRLVGVQNAAAPRSRSHERTRLYTASLDLDNAASAPGGLFVCHVGATSAGEGEARRQAGIARPAWRRS